MAKKRGKIDFNKKLDLILNLERKELSNLKSEQSRLKDLKGEEEKVKHLEERQLKELETLKNLEREIAREVGEHPLRKLTYKDAGRSMIGAFIGIVSHFTVLEGVHFAENVSPLKASFLLLVSFGAGLIMLYYTGFRKIKDVRILAILPLRLVFVYVVTIIAIVITLFVLGIMKQGHVYSQVAVLSLPAIIGACAADLIGGE
ncbi:MAG TPA: DUF2391 family protein [Candidatus Nanoarchaeia archaeon]|nr:DUF2391 family protein [Candidatus Nanoarchaeia archaeon]